MNVKEYKEAILQDRKRYGTKLNHWILFMINPCYRLSVRYRKCKLLGSYKFLIPLYYLERVIYNYTCTKYGCDIPSHVQIGNGFRMDHPNGVVINSKAIIGENFSIKAGAVIGANDKGVPIIKDNVSVGVHALVIGPVVIENNAKIGAGAIVTHNVPEGATMVCSPAHIKEYNE